VSKMVMYTWGPALTPLGLTATTSVLRTPVRQPPCWSPPGPLDCTPGHPLAPAALAALRGACPALLARPPPRGPGGSPRASQGPCRGCWPRGRAGASRAWGCSGRRPCQSGRGGGAGDDRRRPGHRGGQVHGRAGVDGRYGCHQHVLMGPWGQVDVCPGLAACVSERRKTLAFLNGEKYRKNAGESSGHQEGRCSTVGEHEAKVIPLESEAFSWRCGSRG
jgi:hypothetical protein